MRSELCPEAFGARLRYRALPLQTRVAISFRDIYAFCKAVLLPGSLP